MPQSPAESLIDVQVIYYDLCVSRAMHRISSISYYDQKAGRIDHWIDCIIIWRVRFIVYKFGNDLVEQIDMTYHNYRNNFRTVCMFFAVPERYIHVPVLSKASFSAHLYSFDHTEINLFLDTIYTTTVAAVWKFLQSEITLKVTKPDLRIHNYSFSCLSDRKWRINAHFFCCDHRLVVTDSKNAHRGSQ